MKISVAQFSESAVQQQSSTGPVQSLKTAVPVSIIVIAKNEEKTIGRCISSIIDQDYPNLEIIFVDSSSTDRTLSIVESYSNSCRRILITKGGANAAAARNAGLRLARAPIIAFVDGDSYFDGQWLQRAIRYLQRAKDDHVAGVGGPFVQVPFQKTTTALTISEVELTRLAGRGSTREHKEGKCRAIKSLSLSGAVFWSDIVGRVGLFDEKLQYCEDSEFCRRIRAEGYKLLSFGDLGAFHTPKYSTLRIFAEKTWNYGLGRGRAVRKYWKLMTAVGLGAVSYTLVFATLLSFGLITGSTEFKILAMLLGGLYLAAIVISSLAISFRRGSAQVFFLSVAAYLALHVPYTIGLMVGIIAPER